jgi:hypothetical protein
METKTNLFSDLLKEVTDEALKEKISERAYHLQIVESNSTRGGKNPYQGSYESQEASINFSVKKIPKADLHDWNTMDKVDVALISYATQYSYLIELLICGQIDKIKYKHHKDAVVSNTIFILQAVLKD